MVADPMSTLRSLFRDTPLIEEREAGPEGLVAYRARRPDHGPLAGAQALIALPDGSLYADFLDHGLTELAQALSWFERTPPTDVVLFAANHLLFRGMLALAPDTHSSVEKTSKGLVLQTMVLAFPSHAREHLEVLIPRGGPATFRRTPEEAPPEPVPIDAVTALLRALDSDDALQLAESIRAMPQPIPARGLTALARAAVKPNAAIAGDALLKLLSEPGAPAELRLAIAELPSERQLAAREFAEAFMGAGTLT
jgi:hypothetical protein